MVCRLPPGGRYAAPLAVVLGDVQDDVATRRFDERIAASHRELRSNPCVWSLADFHPRMIT